MPILILNKKRLDEGLGWKVFRVKPHLPKVTYGSKNLLFFAELNDKNKTFLGRAKLNPKIYSEGHA